MPKIPGGNANHYLPVVEAAVEAAAPPVVRLAQHPGLQQQCKKMRKKHGDLILISGYWST